MVMSPAKRHFLRAAASNEAAAVGAVQRAATQDGRSSMAGATQYELHLAQLATHMAQLKGIQSIERRVELKRSLIREYQPYIEGVLAAAPGVQDDVLMTMLVWAVDIGDIDQALVLGEYALRHDLQTPERYNRDTATLLAEEIAEAPKATVDHLLTVLELTAERDMPDEVRAKLHKAIGLGLADASIPAALEHLHRAVQLHDKVGVKKDIERLERELRKQREGQKP